jgi:Kef-type K+ transport system membrane component KefB
VLFSPHRAEFVNELTSLGIILLLALLVGHLIQAVRVPEVTGYLLAGVLVGPSALGWVSHENLVALQVFSQVGLGLILFSLGATFEIARLRGAGRRLFTVTLAESSMAAALVCFGMLLLGQPLGVSLLLGAIAVETGAASTLMVMREVNSEGPLTDTLTGVIGLNNVFALVAFSLVVGALDVHAMVTSAQMSWVGLYRSIFPLVWQFVGSAALGFLVGILLASWATQVTESGEILVLLIGCVLLTVGVANLIGASPLVASLGVGATMVNLSAKSRRLFDALARTDPPLYVIFFVLAGAELDLALLPTLGLLGIAYVACRAGGKWLGARFATRRLGFDPNVQTLLGWSIFAQAGLAIGLVLVTKERFPELAPIVATVVLGAVVVFELIGPISARIALVRSGESRPQDADPILDFD